MKVVLLRIGIDSGAGGIHGPLFADGTFEYIPIPDGQAVDERTYGNTVGRHGRKLRYPDKNRYPTFSPDLLSSASFMDGGGWRWNSPSCRGRCWLRPARP